jgi:hypothetical protein
MRLIVVLSNLRLSGGGAGNEDNITYEIMACSSATEKAGAGEYPCSTHHKLNF